MLIFEISFFFVDRVLIRPTYTVKESLTVLGVYRVWGDCITHFDQASVYTQHFTDKLLADAFPV